MLLLCVAAFGIALLVTAASDEGGITWQERVARTIPATPVIAALAAALEMRRARARGELRALGASGASPWQCARAAAMAGTAFALVLVASLVRLPSAVAAFFPRPVVGVAYRFADAQRGFVDDARGWSIAGDGTLARSVAHATTTALLPPHATLAAMLTLGLAGFGLSLLATRTWNAATTSAWIRAALAVTAVLVGFHYAAATGADALPVALVALVLPLDAARGSFERASAIDSLNANCDRSFRTRRTWRSQRSCFGDFQASEAVFSDDAALRSIASCWPLRSRVARLTRFGLSGVASHSCRFLMLQIARFAINTLGRGKLEERSRQRKRIFAQKRGLLGNFFKWTSRCTGSLDPDGALTTRSKESSLAPRR